MKTSQRTRSTPNSLYRKFSTIQPPSNSNNPLFLTQKRQKPNSQLQIAERHQQLNKYIDELDIKIAKIVEFNQAEILLAYRNHFTKVRKQIQQFKEEALNQIKIESSVLERMQKMQRQLIVFRQQALRLFGLVLDKDKVIEELKFKVEEMQSQKKYMDKRMKQLIKTIKEDKQKGITIESMSSHIQQKFIKPTRFQQFGKTFYSVGLHTYKKSKQFDKKMKDRTLTSSNYRHNKIFEKETMGVPLKNELTVSNNEGFKQTQQLQLNSLIKEKFNYLESNIVEDIVKTTTQYFQINQNHPSLSNTKTVNSTQFKKTRYSLRSKNYTARQLSESNKKSFSSLNKNTEAKAAQQDCQRNELILYFQKCVNMIKQQIAFRTKRETINFFTEGRAISIQDFKKIDLFRLMQMVFSNTKITQILFQALVGKSKLSIFSQF